MVIPSPIEDHLGQVWDPRQHLDEIAESNRVLKQFLEDMDAKRLPSATLDHVRAAAGTLGLYAGYPSEACHVETFLDSPEASSSYRTTASVLKGFMEEMNSLILARMKSTQVTASAAPDSLSPASRPGVSPAHEDDIPF